MRTITWIIDTTWSLIPPLMGLKWVLHNLGLCVSQTQTMSGCLPFRNTCGTIGDICVQMLISNSFFHNSLFSFFSFSSIKYKTRKTSCAESFAVAWLNRIFHQSLDHSLSLFSLRQWLLILQWHSQKCYLLYLVPTWVICGFFFKISSILDNISSVLGLEW